MFKRISKAMWKPRQGSLTTRLTLWLLRRNALVVIYDVGESEDDYDTEEYYGYFSTPEEAHKLYSDLRTSRHHRAILCVAIADYHS